MTIEKNDDCIKRSWLLQEIEHDLGCYDIRKASASTMFIKLGEVVKMILAAPKEEVVKVVHCGVCKHWHRETGYCGLHSYFHDSTGLCCSPAESQEWTMWDENGFCSDGEKEESSGKKATAN